MITSDEMQKYPEPFEKIFKAMENDIMTDIVNRIMINDEITRTADWQIHRLVQLGESMENIESIIQESLRLSSVEMDYLYDEIIREGYARDKALYTAAKKPFIPFDDNEPLQQLIEGIRKQTNDELKNFTQTTGFATKKASGKTEYKSTKEYLQKVLDEAAMHTMNGSYDYNSIVKKVVDDMTRSGVRSIDYESGVSNRIDVAVRRAILTGVSQITGKISEDNMKKLDTEYVEVSWHSTARPTHQVWQGRVFYWDKSNPLSENTADGILYKSFIKETGYGTVEGLCGANCRHLFYAFIPGISTRAYTDEQLDEMNAAENEKKEYNGKEYTKYEATQKQRQLEMVLRKRRLDIKLLKDAGMSDEDDEVIFARSRYRIASEKYKDFCEKMELPEQRERVYVDGLKDIGKGQYTPSKKRNLTIEDFEDAASGKEIDPRALEIIHNNSSGQGFLYNEVVVKPVTSNEPGTVLFQTEPYFGGKICQTRLIINEDAFRGRTLEQINDRIAKTPTIVEKTLQEAVWHETGHAKLFFGKSFDKINNMQKALAEIKNVQGISERAKNDGEELIAEIEVLHRKSESIPKEAWQIYKKYIGEK